MTFKDQTMKINQIHCITWKCGLPVEEAENEDWRISNNLPDTKTIVFYAVEEEGIPDIKFWASERSNGEFTVHDYQEENPFDFINDLKRNFAGNPQTAKLIIAMGWILWEDEIELEPDQKLEEGLGEDYCGEMNLSRIKKKLSKYLESTIIVTRTIYRGEADISLAEVQNEPLFVPDGFEPDNSLEAIRVCYRYK
jgi:hypothetical protein